MEICSQVPTLTVRNVEPEIHDFLRQEAARHGHSMEEEVRVVLRQTYQTRGQRTAAETAEAIRKAFASVEGGADFEIPEREQGDLGTPNSFNDRE